jgi:hypothetical protein
MLWPGRVRSSVKRKIVLPERQMDTITTTIKRQWLAEIIAGEKSVEYRAMKPYWRERFSKVTLPFKLRLINGMHPQAPEVTVLVDRIRRNRQAREYGLHIQRVVSFKNWDAKRRRPKIGR